MYCKDDEMDSSGKSRRLALKLGGMFDLGQDHDRMMCSWAVQLLHSSPELGEPAMYVPNNWKDRRDTKAWGLHRVRATRSD
jgi:hypothetical protein